MYESSVGKRLALRASYNVFEILKNSILHNINYSSNNTLLNTIKFDKYLYLY